MDRKKIVIYFSSWTIYREGKGKFGPEDIDPSLCTHINYAFFNIDDDGTISTTNLERECMVKTIGLKRNNMNLKVLASVGGWNEGSSNFSAIAASREKRQIFITSCMNFLRRYDFDGIDLDWEYPGQRGGGPYDKQNFVLLLGELRAALSKYGKILTVAVGAGGSTVRTSYDIKGIARNVDFINLMTYDFHGGFNVLKHNASLPDTQAAVDLWLNGGTPSEQLIVGIPFYGRTFKLSNGKVRAGDPSRGPGECGPYSQELGCLGYNEISYNWTLKWDNHASVPYGFNTNEWLTFEDERSIAEKMKYIMSKRLGGAMVWSIDMDQFNELSDRYPLLKAIARGLNHNYH